MAAALGAIRGLLHFFTDDWSGHGNDAAHVVTILDVLEPRHPRG